MMPEMNGFDVAAVLKNDPATMDIPIVILSIVQDRDRGYRLGVDRYLTKPIDTDLLFREVGALIEQKKSHKRVLVVDEDATTVKTLTDVLTSRGYSVMEARGDDLWPAPWRCSPTSSCSTRCRRRGPMPCRCCASRRAWRTSCSWSTSEESPVSRRS